MVPEQLRPAVEEQLDRLVAGELPELMTWVDRYAGRGATLVPPPDDAWEHRGADAVRTDDDGGWHVVVPLWTTQESPSDLSAELLVDAQGTAVLQDVHVL